MLDKNIIIIILIVILIVIVLGEQDKNKENFSICPMFSGQITNCYKVGCMHDYTGCREITSCDLNRKKSECVKNKDCKWKKGIFQNYCKKK